MTTQSAGSQPSAWDGIRNYFKSFAVLKDNSPSYWGVQAVNFLDCTAYFSMISIASLFLVQNIGLDEVTSGYTITAYGMLVSITLFAAGFITDKLGVRKSLFVAMLINHVRLYRATTNGIKGAEFIVGPEDILTLVNRTGPLDDMFQSLQVIRIQTAR